ncbi:MAG TPA: ATP-binding protein [Bacteroidales bacterium]
MIIPRIIESNLQDRLAKSDNQHKVIIIYGARQVGKTTLIKQLIKQQDKKTEYFNCDYFETQSLFSWENAGNLSSAIKNLDIVVLDEAQRIKNIGLVLKILYDEFSQLQVIATGSSSFELSNQINEPLTGRKAVYKLYPLTFTEMNQNAGYIDSKRNLNRVMRFGLYPSVILQDDNLAQENLNEIASSYLFKDILEFQYLKKPEVLLSLLKLLAFQISNEVSFTELANKLQVDQTVVQKYIQLLEDSFVIFRLPAFKRNLRNEIGKSRKIYFWDIGIRNAIIQQFQTIEMRNDLGALWENFCIAERLKLISYGNNLTNSFFWRTYSQKEIDLVEESEGKLKTFEFKWSAAKNASLPKEFSKEYSETEFKIVNSENFLDTLFT